MPSIANQSILILGGSSGIGFAVAKLCLSQDSRVVIASSSRAKVEDALQRLNAENPKHKPTGHSIDLSGGAVETNLEKLLSDITKQGAVRLDHIVNTAGRPESRPLNTIDLDFVTNAAHLTVFVPLILAKLACKYLSGGHSSSLILTSGQVAEKPIPGYSVMATYATAVYGMVRTLACDLAPRRVNCVSPGATETELWGEHVEKRRTMAAEQSLLGKAGSPEEVAEAYLYLLKNTDATGSIVSSSGGSVLK